MPINMCDNNDGHRCSHHIAADSNGFLKKQACQSLYENSNPRSWVKTYKRHPGLDVLITRMHACHMIYHSSTALPHMPQLKSTSCTKVCKGIIRATA